VEFASLETLRTPAAALGLAGAELSEVFGGLGNGLGVELHLDAAERLACWIVSTGSVERGRAWAIPPSATSKKQIGFSKVAMVCALRIW